MTIKEAIQKSIEGGYNRIRSGGLEGECRINFCLLDPQFWQCLGKAMGWDNQRDWGTNDSALMMCQEFFEHLFSGGTSESFFENL